MIDSYKHGLYEIFLPVGDSLPAQTWRREPQVRKKGLSAHRYPGEGCHGGPLEHPEAEDRTDIP